MWILGHEGLSMKAITKISSYRKSSIKPHLSNKPPPSNKPHLSNKPPPSNKPHLFRGRKLISPLSSKVLMALFSFFFLMKLNSYGSCL